MSKIVFIKENSPEVRKKLEESGYSVCICASFKDSIWLSYHPEGEFPFAIHGEGYCDDEDLDKVYSPLERIQRNLSKEDQYSNEREFYNTVEEFLEHYPQPQVVYDQPSNVSQ